MSNEPMCSCGHGRSQHRGGGLCEACIPDYDSGTGADSYCQGFKLVEPPTPYGNLDHAFREPDRPWIYCVDRLPGESGWYEAALVIPTRTPFGAPRVLRYQRYDDGSEGWLGDSEGIVYAWREAPGVPQPRQRDLKEWPSLGAYLDNLAP